MFKPLEIKWNHCFPDVCWHFENIQHIEESSRVYYYLVVLNSSQKWLSIFLFFANFSCESDRLGCCGHSWVFEDWWRPGSSEPRGQGSAWCRIRYDSTKSDMHIRWQRDKLAWVFLSQCAWFTPDSLQKLICLGHLKKPPQTFGERLYTKAPFFKSAYSHLISHECETDLDEKTGFTDLWVRLSF